MWCEFKRAIKRKVTKEEQTIWANFKRHAVKQHFKCYGHIKKIVANKIKYLISFSIRSLYHFFSFVLFLFLINLQLFGLSMSIETDEITWSVAHKIVSKHWMDSFFEFNFLSMENSPEKYKLMKFWFHIDMLLNAKYLTLENGAPLFRAR